VVASLSLHAPDPSDLSRFELFAEQLALAAELVRRGGLAHERLALVAIDSLAEVVLYRHMQFTFGASEDMGGRLAVRRFGQRERDRLRQGFDRRVTLALSESYGVGAFAFPRPVLDDQDAVILRVAHRYRNGLHHEDRANDELLDPLARLYLTAVGRAWCRAQRDWTVGGLSARRLRALPHIARVAPGGTVAFPTAAHEIAAELLHGMEVEPRELAQRLADDLLRRADETDAVRVELVRCGLAAAGHTDMLHAAELRHIHRADPELVRLQDEASGALERLIRAPSDPSAVEDLRARYQRAEEQQRERIEELRAAFRPQLSLGAPDSLRRASGRLRQARHLDRLLTRYETLDARMRLLEECLAWIDREWDRYTSSGRGQPTRQVVRRSRGGRPPAARKQPEKTSDRGAAVPHRARLTLGRVATPLDRAREYRDGKGPARQWHAFQPVRAVASGRRR